MSLVAICISAGALVVYFPDISRATLTATFTWVGALTLGAIAWPSLRHRSLVGVILVYGFLGFGVVAALLYRPSAIDFNGPLILLQVAQQTNGYHYLSVFLTAAFAVWSVSLAIGVLAPPRSDRSLSATALNLSPKLLPLAALPLLAYLFGVGFHTALHAERYLEYTGSIVAVRLGEALSPVGVLICGYFVFHRNQTTLTRALALILALAYEMLFLATATRFFAFWVPLMFAGGLLTGTWSARRQRIGVLVTAALAILALQIPIGLRNLPNHGLIPATNYLLHQPALVFGGPNPINNLLLGAPLAQYVGHNIGRLPTSDIATSMSPLPSQFNNWYTIAPGLQVNRYTPYSALGELLNHGWWFFLAIMMVFGAAFVLTERIALRSSGIGGALSSIIVFGTAALFVVECTEYHLRSVSRLVYYAFVVLLVLTMVSPHRRSSVPPES